MFLDEVVLTLYSGKGGRGCESYFRRTDKKMVPTGGDGGRGGSVVVSANRNLQNLERFRTERVFRAPSGRAGSGNHKRGRDGEDLVIEVPCGTTLHNRKERLLIRELGANGDEVVVVRGGKGGIGNRHSASAREGGPGESMEVLLSLKIQADIFLAGLPNSGKSLFLKSVTHSQVKETPYPFSTKEPQMGVYERSDYEQIRLCELPSLIKGAHEGKGMGSRFLKHIERAKLLFLFLDSSGRFASSLAEGRRILLDEMKGCDPGFLEIPRRFIVARGDLEEVREKVDEERETFPEPLSLLSSKTGEGIDELMTLSYRILSKR